MTTLWKPNGEWAGETVAVLGNGGMTAELAQSVREFKTIAVNRAVRFAPWADMFVAIDPEHHVGLEFEGLRVVGCDCDMDALYNPMPHERVTIGPSHVIEIRNNLLAAMRLAAGMGAAKIILLGVDTAAYEAIHNFPGLTVGLGMLMHELRQRGIEVVGPKAPLFYRALPGLGDTIHARAVLRELSKEHEVWFDTPWPQAVADLPVHAGVPPAGAREMHCGYYGTAVMQAGGVLAAMSAQAGVPVGDFRLDVPAAWKKKAQALLEQATKPVMVVRPLVETSGKADSAVAKLARNPDVAAYRAIYEAIRDEFFVVSVANCGDGEWLLDPLEADVSCNAGELDFETLAALFDAADLVFCHPGFSAVLAQAVSTPSICVFGGYEDARSFSAGAAYAPWLPIEPVKPCPCWSTGCQGDKTIDLAAAISQVRQFACKRS